jgi:hypothetical protein
MNRATTDLVTANAALEVAAGMAVIGLPAVAGRLLLGTDPGAAGVALGRFAGIALLTVGLACWPTSDGATAQATWSLFTYNLAVAVYLAYLRIGAGFDGDLLLPAAAVHGVLALLLGVDCVQHAVRGVTPPPRTSP